VIEALEALEKLRRGNARFVAGKRRPSLASPSRRTQLLERQHPFAIVLGCADSRVPAELVFDCDLGDLFVIRVAGNIVAPSLVGSVEFAAASFDTKLVVVLGHTRCGAIQATLDAVRLGAPRSPNLRSIIDRIRPAVEELKDAGVPPDELEHRAVRANVRASVAALRAGSPILEQLVAKEGLRIVGAEYDLASGVVDFFELG
jgi:carbonic anhydrase